MSGLSPAVSRFAAAALVVAAALAAYALVVAPVLDMRAERAERITSALDGLRRAEGAAAAAKERRAEIEGLSREARAEQGFLAGGSDALMAAQLQARLKVLVDSARGEVRSMQVLQPRDEGRFRRIAVRAQIVTGIEGAQRVFHGLETATPLLFLDAVEIRAQSAGSRPQEPPREPPLDVRFDVFGYAAPSRAAAPTPGGAR
jgi:general secretion pathway protein M